MKKLILFTSIFILLSACSKDATSNCETVINANGPAFIKAVNNRSETVLVYFGDFDLPFGAELKSGVCEIYGVPAKKSRCGNFNTEWIKNKGCLCGSKRGGDVDDNSGGGFFLN